MDAVITIFLRKILSFAFLALLLLGPAGCATSSDVPEESQQPVLVPSQTKEDSSHGWGTSIQNNSF